MRPTLRARSTYSLRSEERFSRNAETAEQLHEKHLLQATCYAYAVLMEGYAQVECVFVRVEQDRADAPGQPQTVSYRFDAADAEEMGRALARAYHGHGQL